MSLELKCPYCATVNRFAVDTADLTGKAIILCESEIGGCGDYFAMFWHAKAEVTVKRIAP